MNGLFINQKGLEVGVSQGIGANLSDKKNNDQAAN